MKIQRVPAALLIFFWICEFPAQAFSLSDLNLPAAVKLKNDYYEVVSARPSPHQGRIQFHVVSAHAEYDIEGIPELIKLLHEIEVIEKVRRNEATSGFFDGAAASVQATGDGFVNLVSHPVASVKGIGKAAGKLGRGLGGIFRKSEQGEKTSFGEKLVGSSERELAKEFGVDVYTSNPYLKAVLESMARSRAGGKGAMTVLKFLIPVAGLASVALTASGVNAAADELVNSLGRADLFHENEKALLKLGYRADDVKKVLNSPFYSPREATYLRTYLEVMKDVPGCAGIFKTALSATTQWEAVKILYESKMAADWQANSGLEKIELWKTGLACTSKEKFIFFNAYDILNFSESAGEETAKEIKTKKSEWASKNILVYAGGKVQSPPRGFEIQDWKFIQSL